MFLGVVGKDGWVFFGDYSRAPHHGVDIGFLRGRLGKFFRQRSGRLSSDGVWALHVDAAGMLWIGARGGGLDKLERLDMATGEAEFKNYSERHGLPSKVVNGLRSDASGGLWISTNNGLSKFNPKSSKEIYK